MFSGNGVERGVSAYSYVQVLRRQYTSWEQVHRKLFLCRNILPNEIHTMLYSVTRRDSGTKDNRDRIGSSKLTKPQLKWLFGKNDRLPNSVLDIATYIKQSPKKRNIKYYKKRVNGKKSNSWNACRENEMWPFVQKIFWLNIHFGWKVIFQAHSLNY